MFTDQEDDDCSYRKSHAPDLRVQLDVFDDQRESDEVLSNNGPPEIDLSSHVDIFYAILGQVSDIIINYFLIVCQFILILGFEAYLMNICVFFFSLSP